MTRIPFVCLWRMTSSPLGLFFTMSQLSGESPALPSLTFCALVGFLPFFKVTASHFPRSASSGLFRLAMVE